MKVARPFPTRIALAHHFYPEKRTHCRVPGRARERRTIAMRATKWLSTIEGAKSSQRRRANRRNQWRVLFGQGPPAIT
jgi:hypothetical protein